MNIGDYIQWLEESIETEKSIKDGLDVGSNEHYKTIGIITGLQDALNKFYEIE